MAVNNPSWDQRKNVALKNGFEEISDVIKAKNKTVPSFDDNVPSTRLAVLLQSASCHHENRFWKSPLKCAEVHPDSRLLGGNAGRQS